MPCWDESSFSFCGTNQCSTVSCLGALHVAGLLLSSAILEAASCPRRGNPRAGALHVVIDARGGALLRWCNSRASALHCRPPPYVTPSCGDSRLPWRRKKQKPFPTIQYHTTPPYRTTPYLCPLYIHTGASRSAKISLIIEF